MIVLDTNVVSEAMKPEPHPSVKTWLNDQVAETLYLSSVTLAEMMYGIGALPEGRRKRGLGMVFDGIVALFGERVLAFDADAAHHYAALAIKARAAGRPANGGRLYCRHRRRRGYAVATRDAAPFQAAGIAVINPWDAS